MTIRKVFVFFALWFFFLLVVLSPKTSISIAQSLKSQEKALSLISDFADRMCKRIPLEGTGRKSKLSGKGKAEINSLLKRIAGLEIQGSVNIEEEEFSGMLREHLLEARKDNTECREKIFDRLYPMVFPPQDESQTEGIHSPTAVRLEAEKYDDTEGHLDPNQRSIEGGYLSYINPGEWIRYNMVDLGHRKRTTFHARVASATNGGIIKVTLDRPDGEVVASCKVHKTGDWLKWETVNCKIQQPISGKHTIYFVFEGSDNYLFNIAWMEFRS